MSPRTVLVTGANGYIGNAVARAFVRAGWTTYGLIRTSKSAIALATEEILPVIASIDDISSHEAIVKQLPSTIDVIISTTEDLADYISHYNNIISLFRRIASASNENGKRPLVIFSSGCKDYGSGPHYHGTPGLVPHTETSPINAPGMLMNRATHGIKIFDHKDVFGPVLVRPTNVYGRSSSYYLSFFECAAQAASKGVSLQLPTKPNAICHALHVDDCADAYVAIASHPNQANVEGQIFNISSHRYETVDEIAKALQVEYRFPEIEYKDPKTWTPAENSLPPALVDFPQWTGSDKIRKVTGWSDHRPLFTEGLHVYRVAFEATLAMEHENVLRVKGFSRTDFNASSKDDLDKKD